MNSAEVLIKFKGDTSEADDAVKQQEKNLDGLKKKGELAFAGLTAAADAFAASILKSGINYNAEIETYLTRLETLTGSAEEANKILDQIKKDALATPFEVSSLTQAESLLLATGISAEQARGDILALGDAIAASGGGNEELSRMAVNLQQIKNVGKASALDIKQFAYAGIDIYGLLADSMGTTREEASKLDVSYEMLSNALQNASQKGGKYYKAMEKQSKTYNGAMSNLKESVAVLKGELAKGLFNALKKIIPPLTKFVDWLTKNHKIIGAILVPLLAFLNTLAAFKIVSSITTAFKAMWVVLAANPIMAIVAAVAALVAGFIYLWNNCEGFRNFFINMWNVLKGVVETTVNAIKAVLDTIISFFMNVWQGISDIMSKPFEVAFNIIKTVFTTYFDFIKGIFNGIKDIIKVVADFFKSAFETAGNAVKKVFEGMKKTAKTIIDAVVNIIKAPINALIDGLNVFISALNKIKIPNWVPGVGGKGLNFKKIAKLNVGTNYVPEDQLAMVHKGEAVIPKKFNPYANGMKAQTLGAMTGNMKPTINVYVNSYTDPLGQTVSNIKTFSGGAKNDYNYGVGV